MPDSDLFLLAESLRPALLRLSRQLRRESQRLGLSPLDAMLLGLIHKRPGIGVSELAELEMISKPTMSAHIKRLEADGWVERQPDPNDRRIRIVVPTARTLDALADISSVAAAVYDEAMAGLSQPVRRALIAALTVVLNNLSDAKTADGDAARAKEDIE